MLLHTLMFLNANKMAQVLVKLRLKEIFSAEWLTRGEFSSPQKYTAHLSTLELGKTHLNCQPKKLQSGQRLGVTGPSHLLQSFYISRQAFTKSLNCQVGLEFNDPATQTTMSISPVLFCFFQYSRQGCKKFKSEVIMTIISLVLSSIQGFHEPSSGDFYPFLTYLEIDGV